MKELATLNDNKESQLRYVYILIINISSLQLIPVNIIAYRSQYGSVRPTEILGLAIVATLFSTIVGVVFSIVARKRGRR